VKLSRLLLTAPWVWLVELYAASRTGSRPTLASRTRSNSRPNNRPILPVARSIVANRSNPLSSTATRPKG